MILTFAVVEFKIYRPSQPAVWRLFRPNVPAIEGSERWVHCKLAHAKPDALALARPDTLYVGGLSVPTRGGSWAYDSEFGVWIFRAVTETEEHSARLCLDAWTRGRYCGESGDPYRS